MKITLWHCVILTILGCVPAEKRLEIQFKEDNTLIKLESQQLEKPITKVKKWYIMMYIKGEKIYDKPIAPGTDTSKNTLSEQTWTDENGCRNIVHWKDDVVFHLQQRFEPFSLPSPTK